MSTRSFFARTAIVGIGESDYPELYRNVDPTRTGEELAVDAIGRALHDAGLTRADVDGLVLTGLPRYEPLMFRAGLQDVRFLAQHPPSGRMPPVALAHACMAVISGLAECVVLVHAVTFKSARVSFGGAGGSPGSADLGDLYDLAFGMSSPGAFYALAFSRYLHEFGQPAELLAEVPMAIRSHAALNPNAIMRDPFGLEEYLAVRSIARPLRLYDYCLVNDGAVALVVTAADRAADLRQPPVYVAGVAEKAAVREWYVDETYWASACSSLKKDIFADIDLDPADVSSLAVYDNFSPSVLWVLEGFGYAPRGEALEWVQGGRIRLGGELPVNTGGGMLSESYLQGWNLHAEAVRQLRGAAGERQVEDCRAVLYSCLSAIPGADLLVNGTWVA